MAVLLPHNNRWKENVKGLSSENGLSHIVLERKFIPKGGIPSWHHIPGRNVKHLTLENANLILFSTKISVWIYQKGWQFSCHLITGRNVKHLSMINLIVFSTKISVRLDQK